jgi:tetratricopeptide (TPR) repeat protein
MPGLKKAAEIFSALNEDEALRLLTEAGVTHIVVPSWGNFATAYANLLAKAHGLENVDTPFFNSILEQDNFPDWLRPFAYPIPSGAGIDARSVKIFAVLPEQNKFESLFFKGIYYAEIGQADKALAFYRQASRLRPGDMRIKEAIDQLRLFSP